MSDESLLRQLVRVVKEDRDLEASRLDDRWDAFADGRLSPEEEEELRALVKGSPEAEAAYEAFRPLGADFRSRVVEAARFQLEPSRRPDPAPETAPRRGNVRPRVIDARRRWLRWSLPGAALAAATLLLVLWPERTRAPLPPYGLKLGGDVRTLRSEEAEPAGRKLFVPGNRLRLVLTPSVAVEGPVASRAFVLASGGPKPLEAPPPAISEDGAVRFEGEVGADIDLPGGDVFLLVVVGRAGRLPAAEELSSRLGENDNLLTAAWTAWKVPLRIEEGPG